MLIIDFIKGCAIILMVMGHALDGEVLWARNFITAFHMPVFVIAAGYFFASEKVSTLGMLARYCWGKIKRIYFPFVLWTSAFILLHNVFIRVGIYTDNPDIVKYCSGKFIVPVTYLSSASILKQLLYTPLMITGTALSGAMWFLQSLFWAYMLYAIISWLMQKLKCQRLILWQSILSVVFLIWGKGFCAWTYSWLWGGGRALTFYALFHLGVILRRNPIEIWAQGRKSVSIGVSLLFLVSVARVFITNNLRGDFMNLYAQTDLDSDIRYVKGLFLHYSESCENIGKNLNKIGNVLCYIGMHTMPILIFHFLAFKLINLLLALAYGYPLFVMGACPVAFKNSWAWILYSVCGVGCRCNRNCVL